MADSEEESDYEPYYTKEQIEYFISIADGPVWQIGWNPFEVLCADGKDPCKSTCMTRKDVMMKVMDFLPLKDRLILKTVDSFCNMNISKKL